VDSLTDAWHDSPLPEHWQAVEDYTRRQPAVAFGGAVLAGFVLARVLKGRASDD